MINSMGEIQRSNQEIMEEISKGNERIAGIVKIINEISQKTTIINDIVFKTRLLSFNASVEAARAGEHGKGFSVVADEIGSLAQVSGEASKEISMILEASIKKVNEVINETNENVKKLIETGNNKVTQGASNADQCGKVFDDVVSISVIVKEMMNQISIASQEQVDGIGNISVAMNQLDQTTHVNNKSAISSFENSKALTLQSEELLKTVTDLEFEIFGYNTESNLVLKQNQITNSTKVEGTKLENKKSEIKKAELKLQENKPNETKKAELKIQNNKPHETKKIETAKLEPKKTTFIKKIEQKLVKKNVSKAEKASTTPSSVTPASSAPKQDVVLNRKKENLIPSHDDPRFEDV